MGKNERPVSLDDVAARQREDDHDARELETLLGQAALFAGQAVSIAERKAPEDVPELRELAERLKALYLGRTERRVAERETRPS